MVTTGRSGFEQRLSESVSFGLRNSLDLESLSSCYLETEPKKCGCKKALGRFYYWFIHFITFFFDLKCAKYGFSTIRGAYIRFCLPKNILKLVAYNSKPTS